MSVGIEAIPPFLLGFFERMSVENKRKFAKALPLTITKFSNLKNDELWRMMDLEGEMPWTLCMLLKKYQAINEKVGDERNPLTEELIHEFKTTEIEFYEYFAGLYTIKTSPTPSSSSIMRI